MTWPTSQDYNEAIQSAATSFSDPALKGGEVAVNAIGLPVPRSGNFADVYQFKGGDGKTWALKCFTRKVAGLQERYAKIDEHIGKANFPFTVGFSYLAEGIRIRGQWFPVLKMEWVEGFTLNEFVRHNADKPNYLHALMQMWAKLCARLRDGNFAHADLQHGNVLLVPGDAQNKLGLKLIDYDGMWVPSLADHHSGEIGHPNFQHPLRLKEKLYNGDVDRFPHLVIAAALRGTLLGGRALFDKFDNGDNLLFKEVDLRDPSNAKVFKALWEMHDKVLCVLVGKLALASKEPLRKTPWLDDLLLSEEGERLTDAEEKKVMDLLGVGPHFTAAKSAAPAALSAPAASEFADFEAGEDEQDKKAAARRAGKKQPKPERARKDADEDEPARKAKSFLPYFIGGGVAAVALIVGIVAMSGGGKSKTGAQEVVKKEGNNDDGRKVAAPPIRKEDGDGPKTSEPPKKVVPSDPPMEVKKEPPPLEVKKEPPVEPKNDPVVPAPVVVKKDRPPDLPGNIRELLNVRAGPTNSRASMDFTPEADKIMIGSGLSVRTYSMSNYALLDDQTVANKGIRHLDCCPDDSYLVRAALVGINDELYCWDPRTKARRFTIDCEITLGGGQAIARKANTVLVAKKTGGYAEFSLTDGKLLESVTLPDTRSPSTISCTEDGEAVLVQVAGLIAFIRPNRAAPFQKLPKLELKISGSPPFVRLSPDGRRYLVACINFNEIYVHDAFNGETLAVLEGHTAGSNGAEFTMDSKQVVSIAGDLTLRLWDVETGIELKQTPLTGAWSISVAVASNLRYVATATNTAMQLWRLPRAGDALIVKKDAPDPKLVMKDDSKPTLIATSADLGVIGAAFYASNAKKIYAASDSGVLHVLNAQTLEEDQKHTIANARLVNAAATPKSTGPTADLTKEWVYVLDGDKQLHTFDTEKGEVTKSVSLVSQLGDPNKALSYRMTLAPDGRALLMYTIWGPPFRGVTWDLKTNAETALGPLSRPPFATRTAYVTFSADGRFGAASQGSKVIVWNAKTGILIATYDSVFTRHIAIVAEANVIVVANSKQFAAWNFVTGKEIWNEATGPAGGLAAIPKSKRVVYATTNELVIRDCATGKEVYRWASPDNSAQLTVSSDGKSMLSVGSRDKKVHLWDLPSLPAKKP